MMQRGLPRKGAASSLPCIGLLPPQSAEENLCRVRPLQHSEWRVLKGTQFGWNRGTFLIFSGASSREKVCGMKRFFVLLYLSKEQTL